LLWEKIGVEKKNILVFEILKNSRILQKSSLAIPCDSTGVFLVRVFHIYQHTVGQVGSYIKSSVRQTRPFNKIKKKRKVKTFIVRSCKFLTQPDTSWYTYAVNNVVILKKRLYIRGRVVLGPTTYLIKKKKFLKSFVKVL
jgi:ribosomal protein L14